MAGRVGCMHRWKAEGKWVTEKENAPSYRKPRLGGDGDSHAECLQNRRR